MLALQAPSTTKCDMCLVSFCGIHVQGRCAAVPLLVQQPHDLGKLDDLIESPRFFECFDENTVEVNYLIDYMTVQSLTPKHIYHEACINLFMELDIELELSVCADRDISPVSTHGISAAFRGFWHPS